MSAKRIIHVASTHSATDVRIVERECSSLAKAGYDVGMIVPTLPRDLPKGIRLIPIPPPRSGIGYFLRTLPAIHKAAAALDDECVIHFHDPDLLPGMLRLASQGRTIVYDAHEDTPRQARAQHWIPRPLRPVAAMLYDRLERKAGIAFESVVVATPTIAARYPTSKTVVVRNFPLVERFVRVARPYDSRSNVIVYAGGIAEKRGALEMVAAIDLVRHPVSLKLIGPLQPKGLISKLEQKGGWARTTSTGWLSPEDVAMAMGDARVGLVVLRPLQQYLDAYPTKLFEYMAAGLPIVASDFPVWRSLIEQFDCALFVDPESPEAIADAITVLLEDPERAAAMGARGQDAAKKNFDWSTEALALTRLYDDVFNRRDISRRSAH